MKHLNIIFLLFVLMSIISSKVQAHDIEVKNADGVTIYYNWINKQTELSVSYRGDYSGSYSNEYTGKVVIPESVTYIGKAYPVTSIGGSAFSSSTGLTSITIPNSIIWISDDAFRGCTGLTKVTLHHKEIGSWFSGLANIKEVVIGNEVTSIAESAFKNCTGLTSITIPNSVTSIGSYAFYGCTGLTSIAIPNSVTWIGPRAFEYCRGLTSITIPNSITRIGYQTFYTCTGLTSITIPNSVINIDGSAFSGCKGLTSIRVEAGNIVYDSRNNCNAIIETASNTLIAGCKNTNIPNSVTSIGSRAFHGCTGLTSITIPNSVTRIGSFAFEDCTGLTSITIPNSVTSIGNYAFRGCTGLTSITIPNSVTSIGDDAFYNCYFIQVNFINNTNLTSSNNWGANICEETTDGLLIQGNTIVKCRPWATSVKIPNSVISIGKSAFYSCTGLTNITMPNSVTSIGNEAFQGCTGLNSISLSDNIISIGDNAFSNNTKMLVNNGTKTLLYIWNENKNNKRGYTPYDKKTNDVLLAPELTVEEVLQTTATVKVLNTDLKDGYNYSINNETVNDIIIKYTALRPETTQQLKLVVSKDEVHYDVTSSYTTKGMNTKVDDDYKVTASSIRATGSYTEEDAKVVAQRMTIYDYYDSYYGSSKAIISVEGNECFVSGLNPGRSYTIVNEIDVDYGDETTATYRASRSISPARLQFNIAQPKVVSVGNAVVSATVNLDPEEENIGFEWRRTDWTNEFPSNTGQAYLYEGVIEGYIKNLNTDKLWKFRPYYLSDDGTYHYGDWMGLDPTNTSYFEPTVHTYSKINIEGNTALVRGYALAGTANIKVQGFMYWKTSQGSNASHQAPSIPSNAKTITAIGQQIITATLAALDYNSVYHYVAFVTTEDGTTYYGEEQVFTTPTAPAGVDDVIADAPANMKKGVYNLTGVKLADDLSKLQGLSQGVYIINGKKVMVK